MSGETVSVKCASCGATLQAMPEREVIFCQFCGAKQLLKDDNHHRYTYRNVDDARIREADANETIRLKELEIELLRMQDETRQKRFGLWMRLIVVLAYFMILAGIIFLPNTDDLRAIVVFFIPFGVFLFRLMFRKQK